MAELLKGKVAAITGGVTGIGLFQVLTLEYGSLAAGRAIATDFIKHGACVAVNYYPNDKSKSQFEELLSELGKDAPLIGMAGDISKPETGQELVARTVEKWKRLDVFVSNAGVCQFADFLT